MTSTPVAQNLAGKVALVTGSSRGIGAAIARRFVGEGANVIVNYLGNETAAVKVVNELCSIRPGSSVAIKANVSSFNAVKQLSEQALKAFGRIDILVLNAAMVQDKDLSEIDEEDYDMIFNANVKGPLFLTKILAPQLPEGGRVIFFSSALTRASGVASNFLLYTASKGAIEQITRVLARDLGSRQITVNCISPGPIDTEMFHQGKTEDMVRFHESFHPLKRLGLPEEVSGIVALLAGPGGSWINGQTIGVNGAYCV
ncbi:NAD(P)-binding protein [Schizopora paradoxa]|uniref:NAD(P)-binding protein n=1 Tax=Schizopora paradoxa TaxID=27342 RepID=A0A0H2S5Z0_9AGAM|nr:NAD(P)-binding protein [Schizopora paradoxa]